jgi:hypothetical protein
MNQLKGYANAKAYTNTERLPIGGYVIKILDVKLTQNQYGQTLVLSFDIAEGEHKDFFATNYRSQTGEDKKWKGTYRLAVPADDGSEQDEWRMRRFKTVINAFEDSNKGYSWDWDEKKLKGKLIGALFNNKEYEINGKHGFFTNCHSLIVADRIREGKFEIPADTLLKTRAIGSEPIPDGFIYVPDEVEDDGLPFN